MKKLKRSIFLTVFLVLTSTIVNAQSHTLIGGGTEIDPYVIYTIEDWNAFANPANAATYWASGVYVKLHNNIGNPDSPVTTMVGVWDEDEPDNNKPFSGLFLGGNHTITFSLSNTTTNKKYTAPFVYTDGATIKQLTVAGEIVSTYGKAAGLIGKTDGQVTKVENTVEISVNITNGSDGSAGDYCAGVAVDGSKLAISSCIFDGKIIAGSNSAGFISIGNSSNTKIHTSFFKPATGSSITGTGIQNFIANGQSLRFATSYYTTQIGTSTQGNRACASYDDAALSTGFWMKKKLYDHTYYFVSGTGSIEGLAAEYYKSYAQNGRITYTISFREPGLDFSANDVDASYYTAVITNKSTGAVVSDISTITVGTYTLTITGNEGLCKGTLTQDFDVIANFVENGSGTEDDPYLIEDIDDWDAFATAVNGGYSCAGEYVKLNDSITVTIKNTAVNKMVGVWDNNTPANRKPFRGTFDGNLKTITFNVGENSLDGAYNTQMSAPFRLIDGATIKNLTVDGTIYAKKKYMAGLAVFATSNYGESNLINCTSNVIFNCSYIEKGDKDYDCSAGGFIAQNQTGSVVKFKNCIFDGQINKGGQSEAKKCAGFVSYNNGTISYDNCAMIGTIDLSDKGTFHRAGSYSVVDKGAYYITWYAYSGVTQSHFTQASTTAPASTSAKIGKICKGYYIPSVEIEGLETVYPADATVTFPSNVVKWYGRTMVYDTDYSVKIDDVLVPSGDTPTISRRGKHKITIEGKDNYGGGSIDVYIELLSFNTWDDVKAVLADESLGVRHVTLSADITPTTPTDDVVLEVNGTVILNLNGHTIDRGLFTNDNDDSNDTYRVTRGQVIRVNSGASLTINGAGTIKGGFNRAATMVKEKDDRYAYINDAGGIYNMGNLVLNNVIVTSNKCVKDDDRPDNDAMTARGGGIYNGNGSSFTMTGGKVTYNIARGGGGGVYCYQSSSFSMTNVEISHNDSESKGGALRIRNKTSMETYLTGCTVKHNRATETDLKRSSDGGGVYMESGNLRMENCVIGGADGDGNQSAFAGAGFFQLGGTTYAKNCTISYNSAYTEHDKMFGGGICLKAGTYTMDGGVITQNHSYMDGGGVYIVQGATFNVLGYVLIDDNFRTRKGAIPEDTDNNTYTAVNAVITIAGDLDPESRIHITGHGFGGVYTSGLTDYATVPENFVTDGKYQKLNDWDDDLNEINLAPYEWFSEGTWEDQPQAVQDHVIPTNANLLNIKVNRAIELESDEIGYAKSIEFVNGKLVLKDGAQLICNTNATPSVPVEIVVQKNILAAPDEGDDTYGWYTLSLPIDNVNVVDPYENSTNLAASTFDLLRYDEPTHYWDSYNATNYFTKNTFTKTEKGRGYLYRNVEDISLEFAGNMVFGDVTYNITRKGKKLTGFHLIGNPYTHTIYKGGADAAIPNGDLLVEGYYILERDGTWGAKTDATPIKICQGILVKAIAAGTLTMHNVTTGASKEVTKSIMFTVANGTYTDVAYALFEGGQGLNKISHLNDNAPMVYINDNDENYAIATVGDDTKMFNLCFEAKVTGKYTLSIKHEGEFNYLHLIDRLTGDDIDMLMDNEYTFIASATDNANRFIVILDNVESQESFAYQNGSDIVVSGSGELEVFDVMGRLVMRDRVNGVNTINVNQTGVYILRIIGTEIKTQKIIIK